MPSRSEAVLSALLVLNAPLATAAGAWDGRLAAGGLAKAGGGEISPQPRAVVTEPAALAVRRLLALEADASRRTSPPVAAHEPKAIGDRLIVTLDDGDEPPAAVTYEARWDVSGGRAGASDVIVARWPHRALATHAPLRISDVIVGFDDLHGATTWPRIRLALEDPAYPLRPGAGVEIASFTAPVVPLAPGAFRPTDVVRARTGLSLDVPDDWISDGAFDDVFPTDGPLPDVDSRWIECADGTCGAVGGLQVAGGRVVRGVTNAATLAVRLPDPAVDALRPAADLALDATVRVDVTALGAQIEGLALRVMAADAFYRVEFDELNSRILVDAVTPGGTVRLGQLFPVVIPGGVGDLGVKVFDVGPDVALVVTAGGVTHPPIVDDTFLLSGTVVGLSASDPTTSGEAWGDLRVQRRRDVFVLVDLPAGEDAGLPLDVSNDALISGAAHASTDGGASGVARSPGAGCVNAGNPWMQLEVEEVAAGAPLASYEAHVVTVGIDCPTCPLSRNACGENESADERQVPVFTENQQHSVSVRWWNEHLSDDDVLSFAATLFDAPCVATGNVVVGNTAVVGADQGQPSAGGPAIHEATDVLVFTGPPPGDYCLMIQEIHGAPAFDGNRATNVVLRDLHVASECMPAGSTVLVGDSLRLTRPPGDAATTTATWAISSGFPGQFNVHAMEGGPMDASLCFFDVAPIFDRVVGATARTYDLPAPAAGRPLWMAVFEADGCASGNSIPDDSMTDPSLTCWP